MDPSAEPLEQTAVERVQKDVFGFDELRPGQAEVIDDVLEGRPVIGVMPTGAGKSLCYQLPAVLLGEEGGVTLVVSPLIALMKDQVDGLKARGVATAALTSAASAAEQSDILEGIRSASYDIVYVAPERFHSARFLDALSASGDRLALLAIDEAHCISEWGHEFRPAYRMLGDVVKRLEPPRIVALTATATPEVQEDIAAQLGLEEPAMHVRGFARPNLHLVVDPSGGVADKSRKLVERVRTRSGGVAVVYSATRKNAEAYADAIKSAGMRVRVYHAGLADDDRKSAQDAFMSGRLDAIVATNAFGMGVDKADVRVVVHADLPRSPEAYYQEAGRAGRDGAHADCVLLFNHGDARLQEFLIDASYPSAEVLRGLWKLIRQHGGVGSEVESLRDELPGRPHGSVINSALRILGKHGFVRSDGGFYDAVRPGDLGGDFPPLEPEHLARRADVERRKLRSMIEYAYSPRCRHRFLLDYFGEEAEEPARCPACDNCKGIGSAPAMSEEQAEQVRLLLSVVSALSGRFGRTRLAAVANGTDDDDRLIELGERGCLRGQSKSYLMDLLRSLEGGGLVRSTGGEYPTIAITKAGEKMLSGAVEIDELQVRLPESKKSKKKKRSRSIAYSAEGSDADPIDIEAAEKLRELRSSLAKEAAIPAYRIFSNRTLEELARAKPQSLDHLGEIHGIGPAKLESYGEQILEALVG